jgi:hypothetical protein
MRTPLVLPLIALLACARAPTPTPPPAVARPKCPTLGEDTRRVWGAEARTIDIVIYSSMEKCIAGNARHFEVRVDVHAGRSVELPCWRDLRTDEVVIVAPPPGYHGGTFVVDEGMHSVTVVDLDTRNEDHERFSVPHIELSGDGFTVGNHVEAWVGANGVRVRGPVAMPSPRL